MLNLDLILRITSNYELECHSIDRKLPKIKNKKVIGLMKEELGKKINDKICWTKRKNL